MREELLRPLEDPKSPWGLPCVQVRQDHFGTTLVIDQNAYLSWHD